MRGDRGLAPERLREIEAAAEAARGRAEGDLRLLDLGESTPFDLVEAIVGPVTPVPNLLSKHGVRLAGMLDCTGALPRVCYEAYDPLPRQRFSAAHEAGHFMLHEARRRGIARGCAREQVDPTPEDQTEIPPRDEEEADAFAAALLMPARELQEAVRHFGFCSGFLCERFGVSKTALRKRWATLGGRTPEDRAHF